MVYVPSPPPPPPPPQVGCEYSVRVSGNTYQCMTANQYKDYLAQVEKDTDSFPLLILGLLLTVVAIYIFVKILRLVFKWIIKKGKK